MNLRRLLAAMAIRALSARAAQGVRCCVDVASRLLTMDSALPSVELTDLHQHVAEVGARLSGFVAGCGCDANAVSHCYRHLCAPHPCRCGCHDAAFHITVSVDGLKRLATEICSHGPAVWTRLALARAAFAARPKPEPVHDELLGYAFTAPGGSA